MSSCLLCAGLQFFQFNRVALAKTLGAGVFGFCIAAAASNALLPQRPRLLFFEIGVGHSENRELRVFRPFMEVSKEPSIFVDTNKPFDKRPRFGGSQVHLRKILNNGLVSLIVGIYNVKLIADDTLEAMMAVMAVMLVWVVTVMAVMAVVLVWVVAVMAVVLVMAVTPSPAAAPSPSPGTAPSPASAPPDPCCDRRFSVSNIRVMGAVIIVGVRSSKQSPRRLCINESGVVARSRKLHLCLERFLLSWFCCEHAGSDTPGNTFGRTC